MLKTITLAAAVLTTVSLAACSFPAPDHHESVVSDTTSSPGREDPGPHPTTGAHTPAPEQDSGGEPLSSSYSEVLKGAPAGTRYALEDVSGDGKPELLLRTPDITGVRNDVALVEVFDTQGRKLDTGSFYDGAASAGGGRYELAATSDGTGLLMTSWMSMNPETTTELWTLNNGTLRTSDRSWSYTMTDPSLGPVANAPAELAAMMRPVTWSDSPTAPVGQPTAVTGTSGSAVALNPTAPGTQIGDTCGYADGATVTAGDSTSCGFAMAVARAALSTRFGPDTVSPADVTGYAGIADVTASSPTNGQTYTMSCGIGSAGNAVTCNGGNNASVRIQEPGNGTLLHLTD
ncbi:hypothetical protein [Corynebacterium neomassiliense]|uniref:hypothetical protein n=1 Tax=Corynebacterium neomassiliense TaxID=2079482 RepID=UPI001030459A|nr:hypothetical protein [Corynebacterium neomassiliense]